MLNCECCDKPNGWALVDPRHKYVCPDCISNPNVSLWGIGESSHYRDKTKIKAIFNTKGNSFSVLDDEGNVRVKIGNL